MAGTLPLVHGNIKATRHGDSNRYHSDHSIGRNWFESASHQSHVLCQPAIGKNAPPGKVNRPDWGSDDGFGDRFGLPDFGRDLGRLDLAFVSYRALALFGNDAGQLWPIRAVRDSAAVAETDQSRLCRSYD